MSEQEFQAKPLENIFSKSEAVTTVEPVKVEPVVKEPEKGADQGATPALDKDGKPIVADAAKPEVKTDDPFKVLKKALKDVQRDNSDLRKRLESSQRQPEPVIDPLIEPEKFTEQVTSTVERRILRERFDDAMDRGREDYGEEAFDEAVEFFAEAVAANPTLAEELTKQRKPDKFVWKYVQEAKARQELGDPVAFEQKIRADERTKLLGEVDKMVEEKLKTALQARLPSSLAGEQTQGGRASQAATEWAGPKPLEQIFARK